MGERYSPDCKTDDTDYNEDDAYNSSGFHESFLVPSSFCAQLPGCCCTRLSLSYGAIQAAAEATFRLVHQAHVDEEAFATIFISKYGHPEPWMQALNEANRLSFCDGSEYSIEDFVG
jgi:hypothetical protein